MKTKSQLLLTLSFSALWMFNSCKPDDPAPTNEEELITSLVMNFTDSATQQVNTFQFRDPDGAGGNSPIVFDSLQLKSNSTYYVSILLLDESKSPVDTISNEVEEEGVDHQFFYNVTNVSVQTSYEDQDANGAPIGLESKWKTGVAGIGSVMVVLKHQPGEKNGSQSTGETDVEVNFPTEITD
ncbi:MAG: hypothetical protein K1X82_05800 [Bacteroidia bacterium]|nr:hypothetical protein [Bacteroidia bacterium]